MTKLFNMVSSLACESRGGLYAKKQSFLHYY